MLSNARGKHSSPGVYMEEINKRHTSRSLGITTLGVVGETLKGPAFEPVHISDWMEYQDYFGGTSTEKFNKGNGYPKYELPYIAKSYLQESKQLEVCRVLGLSGYDAGKSWIIYGYKANDNVNTNKYVIGILRSKAIYTTSNNIDPCSNENEIDKIKFLVNKVEISNYATLESVLNGCKNTNTAIQTNLSVGKNQYGTFKLTIETERGSEAVAVSLNPGDKNYIVDVLGMSPQDGDYSLFVEEIYDLAHINCCDNKSLYDTIGLEEFDGINNYKETYRCAFTPWFVSEIKGNGTNAEIKKLFRFYTISDGNAANSQIKISITNILPDEGLFDIIIRDYYDNDTNPIILERFNKCNMVPGSPNYIGLKIGTYNGEYDNKSKYVTVEVIENDMTEACVPCGFLGYPMRSLYSYKELKSIQINSGFNDSQKHTVDGVEYDLVKVTGDDVEKLYIWNFDKYIEIPSLDSKPTQKHTSEDGVEYDLVKVTDGTNEKHYIWNVNEYIEIPSLSSKPTQKYTVDGVEHDLVKVKVTGDTNETLYIWKKTDYTNIELDYNTDVYEALKPNKQYFGMSDIVGVDVDVLNYKGKNAYASKQHPSDGYSKGFHLDSFINAKTDGYFLYKKEYGAEFTSVGNEPIYDLTSGDTFSKFTQIEKDCYLEVNDENASEYTSVDDLDRFSKNNESDEYNKIKYDDSYYDWTQKHPIKYIRYNNDVYEWGKTQMMEVTVDGISGYEFVTPNEMTGSEQGYDSMPHITSEDLMEKNIYNDKRYRKFTCYPYGGFDGWDIYREERTNTKNYKANKYKGVIGDDYTFNANFDASALGLSGKVISSDYYAYLAGYKQFDNPSKIKINLLATPGIDYVNNLELVNEVLDIIEEDRQGDCLYIVTTPDKDKDGFEIDPESAVSNLESQEISTSYMATYYPWVKYYDSVNKKYISLPVTKDVMRNFAHTDNVSQSWFASAGMSRGNVDCTKATRFTKLDEEDTLYEAMINPVKSFGSDGVKIWGNKTLLNEDTPVNRINVRRLMIRIKDMVRTAAQQLVFEQNDNTLDSQFRSIVDPILSNVKQNRGITDYKIKTDTSVEAKDRKELPAAIYVKPINCLEYIPITFSIYPEGVNFEE